MSIEQLWIQWHYFWLFFSCYWIWNTIKHNKEKCNVNILLYPNVNLQYTYEHITKIWWIVFTSLSLKFTYLRWEKIQNLTRIFRNTSSFSKTNQIKNIPKHWCFRRIWKQPIGYTSATFPNGLGQKVAKERCCIIL